MPDTNGNDAVREAIARRAYERFCERGCVHGADVEDWLAAEQEVLSDQQSVTEEQPAQAPVATAADAPSRGNRKSRR